jgi:hypothetical protein
VVRCQRLSFDLIDERRIIHLLSWHQVQDGADVGDALKKVKDAGLIPEDRVRLCGVCDAASWIGSSRSGVKVKMGIERQNWVSPSKNGL